VLGPSIAGVLLKLGFGRLGLFLIAAGPMLLTAALIRRIPYREGSETHSEEPACLGSAPPDHEGEDLPTTVGF
jgi:hypothetical protein